MELRRPHESTTGHSSDPRCSTRLGASRLCPASTTRQGSNDGRPKALTCAFRAVVTKAPGGQVCVTGWSCAGSPCVERRLNRAVCTRWHGICLAWLRSVGSCGHVGSDLRLYPWQQLSSDNHGRSCQGLSKDSDSSRRVFD